MWLFFANQVMSSYSISFLKQKLFWGEKIRSDLVQEEIRAQSGSHCIQRSTLTWWHKPLRWRRTCLQKQRSWPLRMISSWRREVPPDSSPLLKILQQIYRHTSFEESSRKKRDSRLEVKVTAANAGLSGFQLKNIYIFLIAFPHDLAIHSGLRC